MEKLPVVNIINQHTRRFFRDIGGFILPLIASGVKIQIFIRSRDLLCCFGNIPFQIDSVKKIIISETLVRMCLEESGCSVTPEMVDRLSGNNSAEKKESAMASFQDRLERDVPGPTIVWF